MRVFYLPCELGRRLSYIEGSSARVACLISFGHIRSWRHICNWHHELVSYQKLHLSSTSTYPSCTQSVLQVDSSSCVSTQRKLENALKNNLIDEAWVVFSSHKSLHCLPNQELVKKMVNLMTSSSSSHFLLRAYKLVLLLLDKRQDLIDHESLIRLALSLARNQKPVAATTILRTLLDKSKLFSLDILSTIFFHLVKSEVGSCLASTMLIEICELSLFQKSVTRNCKQLKLLNQSVTIFNLVLDSCSRYGSFLKAQVIIDLMSQIGVVADINSIIIFSRIYEKIGQRDELVRLKVLVDGCQSMKLMRHYCQLFDSLLSLHFRYNDLDAAAELMLDLYSHSESFQCVGKLTTRSDGLRKPCLLYIGSVNLRSGHCIMVEPERLGNVLTVDLQVLSGLVHFSNGKLVPSVKALAKIINGFVKERNFVKLSNLLFNIDKKIGVKEGRLSSAVFDSWIQLGWLDTAHDVLDVFATVEIPVEAGLYKLLLKAYSQGNRLEESIVLLKQMRKMGLFVNLSDEEAIVSCLSEEFTVKSFDIKSDTLEVHNSCFAQHMYKEMREEDSASPLLYELNSTVLFFCKANMMEDAMRTVKRMEQRNVQPTVQTFSCLLSGYSSLKMYRQITILWGDVKRRMEDGALVASQDFLELFMMNFIRGGYFERAMELANYMTRHHIYADKWKYKKEFLKFHKDLYRNLKAAQARTDVQRKRFEHVQAFKKWVKIARR